MLRKSIRCSDLPKDENACGLYPGGAARPSGRYFFSPANQLRTIVIGFGAVEAAGRLKRNRSPSRVTAEPWARGVAKRSRGTDVWNEGVFAISTTFRISGSSKYI